MTNIPSKALFGSCGLDHFNLVHPTNFVQHPGITLQDVLKREYTLRLLVDNEERALHTKDSRTWTLVERPYVL